MKGFYYYISREVPKKDKIRWIIRLILPQWDANQADQKLDQELERKQQETTLHIFIPCNMAQCTNNDSDNNVNYFRKVNLKEAAFGMGSMEADHY